MGSFDQQSGGRSPAGDASADPGGAIDENRRVTARAQTRELAHASIGKGSPCGWFETVYQRAAGDVSSVPWADLEPHPLLAGLLDRLAPRPGARTLVIGCGLGDDAAECARRGLDVEAFDLSETAVEWARRRHPGIAAHIHARDLFELPEAFDDAFDVVVEVYTLQAIPADLRPKAFRAMAKTIASGGALLAVTRALPEDTPLDAKREGPPWPLARAELERWGSSNQLTMSHAELSPPPALGPGSGKLALILRR